MKLGLYGGTFSPPHNGHRRIAEAFLRAAELDLLLIMPASVPPHKESGNSISTEARYDMARLAFADLSGAVVSRLELDRTGKSYTYDTLMSLCEIYGLDPEREKLALLCGTDMFLKLDAWYRSADILRMTEIYYAPRGEAGEAERLFEKAKFYEEAYGASVHELKLTPYKLSSSELRAALALGEDVSEHIAPSVYDYIERAGLYRGK